MTAVGRDRGHGTDQEDRRSIGMSLRGVRLAWPFVACHHRRAVGQSCTLPRYGGTGATLAAALAYAQVSLSDALSFWLLNTLASIVCGTGNIRLPAGVVIGWGTE